MPIEVDILEDNILRRYTNVFYTLLLDQTTGKNIFWATDNYENLGKEYSFFYPIKAELITGSNGNIIMPRVLKNKSLQKIRIKERAEVYTPSWVCNKQINSIDDSWFNKQNVFNKEIKLTDGTISWKTNEKKIKFSRSKKWKDYVSNVRLEVSCGEAPYLISRYDTTTGSYIPVRERIGFLDRKLRVISENIKRKKEWLKYAELAYKSIYGYEYHGDSLLLARESLLYTFLDNYIEKFNTEPELENIQKIAYIISWNIWQMDGLKHIVPESCSPTLKEEKDLFNNIKSDFSECKGCKMRNNLFHNGIYCIIKDWTKFDPLTNEEGHQIRFIDLIQGKGSI